MAYGSPRTRTDLTKTGLIVWLSCKTNNLSQKVSITKILVPRPQSLPHSLTLVVFPSVNDAVRLVLSLITPSPVVAASKVGPLDQATNLSIARARLRDIKAA